MIDLIENAVAEYAQALERLTKHGPIGRRIAAGFPSPNAIASRHRQESSMSASQEARSKSTADTMSRDADRR